MNVGIMARLVAGNSHQFKIYGPFPNVTDADRWAQENIQHGHQIIKIHEVSPSLSRPSDIVRQGGGGVGVSSTFTWDRLWNRSSE